MVCPGGPKDRKAMYCYNGTLVITSISRDITPTWLYNPLIALSSTSPAFETPISLPSSTCCPCHGVQAALKNMVGDGRWGHFWILNPHRSPILRCPLSDHGDPTSDCPPSVTQVLCADSPGDSAGHGLGSSVGETSKVANSLIAVQGCPGRIEKHTFFGFQSWGKHSDSPRLKCLGISWSGIF